MSKVVVIGLDGATWELLMPLATKGFLPALAKLMSSGSYGELHSTVPPLTATAWASFATGKNPGKTGVFDFVMPGTSLGDMTPVTSRDIYGETFYEILNDNGRRTIMANLPLSYPPRTGNPTITSIMTQGSQLIFPENLTERIPELKEYRLIPNFDLKIQGNVEGYIEDIRSLEQIRFRCAQKLLGLEWDLFFVLFSGTDWVQHEVYDMMISGSLGYDHVAFQLFRDIDSYVGWFVDHLPNGAHLLLVSDHGFAAYKGVFYLNQWLKENGFLVTRYTTKPATAAQHRFAKGIADAKPKAKRSIARRAGAAIACALMNALQTSCFHRLPSILQKYGPCANLPLAVDYRRTRAVCTSIELSGVFLNPTGRFRNGIVEAGDASELRERIISGLRNLRDPITNGNAFGMVADRSEIYWGERAMLAPDIAVVPNNFLAIPNLPSQGRSNLFDQRKANFHSLDGIFLAYGPAVQEGHRIHQARIYDIAPTLLHILGVPASEDMDGRVLKEIFADDSELAKRPVEYTRTDERKRVRHKASQIRRSGRV